MVKQSTVTSRPSLRDALWGEERPFFWLLTLVMIFIYLSAVVGAHLLQTPGRFAVFTTLMVIHVAVHWQSARLTRSQSRWVPWYLLGQGVLAFALGSLAPAVGLILGLYMALIGEAFGMLYKTRWVMVAVGGYLLLSALNFLETAQWRDLLWWLIAMAPMTFFVSIYVYLYSRQSEARNKAQALSRELEAANRQLTEYSARVADLTRAAERQRMARELHDTLAQGLAGLILQLEAADSHLQSGKSERARVIVEQSMARARATLADARRAIDDLRSESAAPANLAEAVRAEAGRFTAATRLPCELDLALRDVLPDVVGEQAVRAVAEGLTNIARHARASRAWVAVRSDGAGLTIEIRDDGCGFDCAAAAAPGHYGLLGMRERARLAHGTFDLVSAPGAGTTLKLRLPLTAGQEAPAAAPDGATP
jgi:NarL family two-component system sensor histidine kinase YdfH